MSDHNAIIRINAGDSDLEFAVEWDRLDRLTFREMLEIISRSLPHTTTAAFDYLDEERDPITVRSEEEMAIMISYYKQLVRSPPAQEVKPLVIYPRAIRSPKRRNIEGLKVQIKGGDQRQEPSVPPTHQSSSKVKLGDIREILRGGVITDKDLVYVDILGSGNGGTVYRANHKDSHTAIAVKVIPLDVTPETQRQIMSELEILYKCNSPVIIGFYGAFFVENRISICTEFMDGGSLDKYGAIPEIVLGRIAVSVVKGLQYLWSLKIMHRDVKPSNILVNTQGEIKLCDFGVSVQLVNSIAQTYVGTNLYMAPERIEGKGYGVHSEVWSLGISLFEMAVGRFPYESAQAVNKPMQLLTYIVQRESPLLPRSSFTESFVNLVSHCMHKDPKERPSPEALMYHPFIRQNDDGNTDIVSQWVRRRLQDMQHERLRMTTNSA